MTLIKDLQAIEDLSQLGTSITAVDARKLIKLITKVFCKHLTEHGFERGQITKLTTKLRDAGRRSPPWKAFSSRVPGRPQDGADGNRTSRWILDSNHKFYADEVTATLVEVKYYLQCLSMEGAPPLPEGKLKNCFSFLIEHEVEPGNYVDPIQKVPIPLPEVIANARIIQSGHIVPLDRSGKHEPSNTFLMLHRSNQLQGNLTVNELLDLMERILQKHDRI
jgi:hypothetical protein